MQKEKYKSLQEMTLLDNFLFREVADNEELFNILIDILLERHIEFLQKFQTEKILGISPELRTARMDVYNMDISGQVYAIEMQARDTKNLRKRSRFYQSKMDEILLLPGSKDFNQMRDICLIIICPFDLFGKGACRYTFHEVCEEYPDLRLQDGGNRIFINTTGKNRAEFSREFVELMDYINAPVDELEKHTTTEAVRKLHEGIQCLKESEKIGVRYMQRWEERLMDREEAWMEGHQEGHQEGIKEGIKEGKRSGQELGEAKQIIELGEELGWSLSVILQRLQDKLSISLSKAQEYCAVYGK